MSNPYPEHERLQEVSEESQQQGAFLEWLMGERGLVLAEWDRDNVRLYRASYGGIVGLLAEYHDIDLNKIEEEKRAMLESIRSTT